MMSHLEILESAIGWALWQSLWQISLIGIVAYGLLRLLPEKSYGIRYRIVISSLILSMILFVLELCFYSHSISNGLDAPELLPIPLYQAASVYNLDVVNLNTLFIRCWGLGFSLFLIRWMLGQSRILQIRQSCLVVENTGLKKMVNRLCTSMNITQKVRLAESHLISSACTIGTWRPLILLPLGMTSHLTQKELMMICSHELQHIRQFDYILHQMAMLIHAIFYFHPVIWWLMKQADLERESICDHAVIRQSSDRIAYARLLIRMEELVVLNCSPGIRGQSSMHSRIARIFDKPSKNDVMTPIISTLCLAFWLTTSSWTSPQPMEVQISPTVATPSSTFKHDILSSLTTDTLPVHQPMRHQDVRKIEIKEKNGIIHELRINGQVIPPAAHAEYQQMIDSLPAPPPPPAPPALPAPSAVPVPPAPDAPPADMKPMPRVSNHPDHAPQPPTPPAPPAPPAPPVPPAPEIPGNPPTPPAPPAPTPESVEGQSKDLPSKTDPGNYECQI